MAYSSGFNPHPRISFANASPTGAATEADYLEIGTSVVCDPDKVREALNAALPTGLDLVAVVAAEKGTLAERLHASHWRVECDADRAVLEQVIAEFLARDHLEVQRMTKSGMRTFDVRQAVVTLTAHEAGFETVLRHTTPLVRPDDVLSSLRIVNENFTPENVLLTRLAQGPLHEETVADPLAE